MPVTDLYTSSFILKNKGHFASIVRVAIFDGVVTDSEKAFLNRLASNLNISDDEHKDILSNYKEYPLNPPVSYDQRIERLYDLTRMVHADDIDDEHEINLLEKIAIGLGFSHENSKYIVDKALTLVNEGVDLDDFTSGLKNMNQ